MGYLRSIITVSLLTGGVLAQAQGLQSAPDAITLPPNEPAADVAPAEVPLRASAHDYLRAGDKAFESKNFDAAELEYRRAADLDPGYKSYYNLGLTLAQLGRAEEAAENFERAKRYADTDVDRADASYNAGNAQLSAEDLEASVKQYVDALRANPDDLEAKQNLTQVLKQLGLMQPPPQQQQQDQQEEEGEEGEQQENQQQEPQPNEEQPEPEEPGDENEPQDGEEDEPQEDEPQDSSDEATGPSEEELDREEAQRLLELAEELERKTQKKLKLENAQRRQPEKDW